MAYKTFSTEDIDGEKPLGAFIRSITGLEQTALNDAFAAFLQVGVEWKI